MTEGHLRKPQARMMKEGDSPMSKTNIPANKATTTVNNTKAEEPKVEQKKEKPVKPGLKSHQFALKLLEGALSDASTANDPGAVRILTKYVKNVHYMMRPWAKVSVTYSDDV
jgi:hypothetical protein